MIARTWDALSPKIYKTIMVTSFIGLLVLVVLNPSGTSEPIISDYQPENETNSTSKSNNETSNIAVTPGEGSPNLWDNGIFGLLFVLGAAFAPRITLVFFASISWNVWFLLGVSLFPELTLIFLAVSRGYHHNNYLIILAYCLWKIITLRNAKTRPAEQPNQGRTSLPLFLFDALVPLRQTEAMQLLMAAQDAINLMKRQLAHHQHRISLLEMDPGAISMLTISQLSKLRELMQSRLHQLDQVLSKKAPTESTEFLGQETCVICLTNPSLVLLSPCQHKALCDECFVQWQERDETTCPVCRLPILGHLFCTANYTQRISEDDYNRVGISHTSQELLKLYKHVKENPSELKKLEKCDLKEFEQYM